MQAAAESPPAQLQAQRIIPQELRILQRVAAAARGYLEQGRDVPFLRRLRGRGLVERMPADPDRWQLTEAGAIALEEAEESERDKVQIRAPQATAILDAAAAERPTIVVDTEIERMVQEATLAMAVRPEVYQRGGKLVQVMEDSGQKLRGLVRQLGAPRIREVPMSQVRMWLSSVADFRKVKIDQRGEVVELYPGRPVLLPVVPPETVVQAVLQLGRWPEEIRHLEGIVETPMLRPDGTILQTEGYDPQTGIQYLQPDSFRDVKIPDSPTPDDVRDSLDWLLDIVHDFPFKTDAHRSAWLSGLLSYFARFAIRGPCPLFLVDKNVRGAGSGLLVSLVGRICQGRDMALNSQATDEAAEKAMITSVAMSGELLVQLDNIARPLGSSALDAALTTTSWSDRPLYTNDMPRLPLLAIWWVTGNNVQFRDGCDTARRALHIRLESPHERPEQRGGFRHANLLGFVEENRPQLVRACLTLLRGYCAAGRPTMGLSRWGSYDAWSSLVRACVVWAGLADPYDAHEELVDAADNDMQLVENLIVGLQEVLLAKRADALTIQEIYAELNRDLEARRGFANQELRFERLINAFLQLCHCRDGRLPPAHILGNRLRRYKGRTVKGRRLETVDKAESGWRWTVRGGAKPAERVPAPHESARVEQ